MWYEFKNPYTDSPNDLVTYEVSDGKKKTDHRQMGCYGSHIRSSTKYTFFCRPLDDKKKSELDGGLFLRWIDLCKLHNLCVYDAVTDVQNNKNYFTLDARKNTYHENYASLCCYRWAEQHAGLCYTVMKLMDLNPQTHFYQALHYAMSKHIKNVNHNFVSIGSGYSLQKPKVSLSLGLATCYFFMKKLCHRGEYVAESYTNAATASLANKLVSDAEKSRGGCSTAGNMYSPITYNDLFLPSLPAVLWDEWSRLYEMEVPDGEEIKEFYASVMRGKQK